MKAHLVGTRITNAAIVGGKPVCQKMHHEGRVHARAQQVIYIIQSNLLAKHHTTIEVGVVIALQNHCFEQTCVKTVLS